MIGDLFKAVQDFRMGIPGMLVQIFGGYFQNTTLYVKDGITDYSLWQMKHMELIWLFTRYYAIEDLRSFFIR